MMTHIVERAYALAKSGKYALPSQIGEQLRSEGYGSMEVRKHLEGAQIRADLRRLCKEAAAKK